VIDSASGHHHVDNETGAINHTDYFSWVPHAIHDKLIDVSSGHHHPENIHDLEGDVNVTPNTNQLSGEHNKRENVEARSEIKLFSPMDEVLQTWKHCDIPLWSPLQYLSPETQLL
jgi:hypothetical protein